MRVAIDTRPLSWGIQGGIARFGRNIINSLRDQPADHEWVLYGTSSDVAELFPDLEFHLLPKNRILYSMVSLPRALRQSKCSALVALSPEVFRRTIPTVSIVYDLYPLDYSKWMPNRFKFTRTYWQQVIQTHVRVALLRHLDAAVAISEYTAAAIRVHIKTNDVKISVVYPAADPMFSEDKSTDASRRVLFERLGVTDPYFLYVGALNWHKNVRTIIKAFRLIQESSNELAVLVIVGHENWPKEDLHLVNEPNVVSIPILDDSDLAILYSHTVAFIYLSLDEGFGLPVVEAMSMGAPVIVSRRGALPEVVGSAGFQVEPEDEDQVRNAMALLLSSSTERVRQRVLSIKRAGSFSWKDAANDLVECISQITS